METEPMSMELRLAAIISLLTSSTLRGASSGRVEAICAHLKAAVHSADVLDCYLKKTLENVLTEMQALECRRLCRLNESPADFSSIQTLH